MTRTILLGLAFLISACASQKKAAVAQGGEAAAAEEVAVKRSGDHPVYVGHGSDGELVMASTHHGAMNGVAVANTDLDIKGKEDDHDLVCKREMLTGTHVPQWICRYKTDIEQDQLATRRMLDNMPKACMDKVCNQ